MLSVCAAVVVYCCLVGGKLLQSESSAKLFAQTYLLVTFSAPELAKSTSVFIYALTRIAGAALPQQKQGWLQMLGVAGAGEQGSALGLQGLDLTTDPGFDLGVMQAFALALSCPSWRLWSSSRPVRLQSACAKCAPPCRRCPSLTRRGPVHGWGT